ncbi:hypothetical protein RDMS_02850 [Deinococcus sp. RL]|uniref:hypothetical protein n=1 Tax=Deinococcus sp. RL TaxID=1489678 RepID=UPI0004D7FD71|nr:hypothetical protein [Deinococcus sp. RL]KEF35445.1 hypothetical protein RDMS_02850 [Deinococcus sp. RL]
MTQNERAVAARSGGGFGEGAGPNPAGQDPAAAFAELRRQVEAAVASGNAAALGQIAQNPALPQGFREGLSRLPAQALATPEGRAGVQRTLEEQFRAYEVAAEWTARAVKEAFAGAIATIYRWSIGGVVLALLATAMMPNLPLPQRRRGGEDQPAPVPAEL